MQPNSDSHAAVSSSFPQAEMQDEEVKEDENGAAERAHGAIPPSSTSPLSISSSSAPSLLSSMPTVSSSCRQSETLVVSAAVYSQLTQQGREETVEQESGDAAEAVAKDSDETIAHSITHPNPLPTLNVDTNPIPLPLPCMTPLATEPQCNVPQESVPSEVSRGRVVGKKRKIKHGGGTKQKSRKRMMP